MPRNRLTRARQRRRRPDDSLRRRVRATGPSARSGPSGSRRRPARLARGPRYGRRPRSRRDRRVPRAARGGSRGRHPGSRRNARVPLGMLDVERMLEDIDGVDERFSDLEDRVTDPMPRRRAEAEARSRLGVVSVPLEQPCGVERGDDRRRRILIVPSSGPGVRHRLRRCEHALARVRGLELVGPYALHEAAEVVPVEVCRDQDVGLGGNGPCGRAWPDRDQRPRPASTSTV